MNRLLSIIVSLVVLFFIYLWISHLTTSPKYLGDKKESAVEIDKRMNDSENDEAQSTTVTEETQNNPPDSTISRDEEATSPEPAQENQAQPLQPPKSPAAIGTGGTPITGGYLIIAGNFLERTNAEKHLRRLRDLGYSESEIVHFELSEYHTVCAGRFDNPDDARQKAKRISDAHGIDTYIRAVNQ